MVMHTAGRKVGLARARVLVEAEGQERSYLWHAPGLLVAARTHDWHGAAGRPPQECSRHRCASRHQDHSADRSDPALSTPTGASTTRSPWPRLPSCQQRNLPFPPYALGAWLGDGTTRAAS